MDGDTVTVVNNHLETSGLSLADRAGFKDMVKGKAGSDTVRAESKRLAVKLGESAKIRAPQAEAVAEYVRNSGDNVILCGDLTTTPYRTLTVLWRASLPTVMLSRATVRAYPITTTPSLCA